MFTSTAALVSLSFALSARKTDLFSREIASASRRFWRILVIMLISGHGCRHVPAAHSTSAPLPNVAED